MRGCAPTSIGRRCAEKVARRPVLVSIRPDAQYLPHFAGEILEGKGLLQERGTGAEHSLVEDRVFGVSGEIEHSKIRAYLQQPFRQFSATHAWHDHVRDQDIDSVAMGFRDAQAAFAIFRFQDFIATSRESLSYQFAD